MVVSLTIRLSQCMNVLWRQRLRISWLRRQMETFSASLAFCKGQWRGALMFSLICARANSWANNGDLRRHLATLWRHCNDIDGLVQERRKSSASAMELRLSCTNPSITIRIDIKLMINLYFCGYTALAHIAADIMDRMLSYRSKCPRQHLRLVDMSQFHIIML